VAALPPRTHFPGRYPSDSPLFARSYFTRSGLSLADRNLIITISCDMASSCMAFFRAWPRLVPALLATNFPTLDLFGGVARAVFLRSL
jgi:hypothetical protein